jgi:hypothetical protein
LDFESKNWISLKKIFTLSFDNVSIKIKKIADRSCFLYLSLVELISQQIAYVCVCMYNGTGF